MLRFWTILTICAALAGAGTWIALEHAYAQAPAVGAHVVDGPTPGTVQPDGSITGVPQVEPTKAGGWVVDVIRQARDLARSGAWGPFVALLLTALASLFSLALRLIPDLWAKLRPHLGYVTIGLTLAMYLAGNLAALEIGAGAMDWLSVIGRAVAAGMAACGGWELILKPLIRRFLPKLARLLGIVVGPETKPLPAPVEPKP